MAIVPMDANNYKMEARGHPVVGSKAPRQYTESFLYDALYPLIATMRVLGLYHSWHTKSRLRCLSLIYSLVPGVVVLSTFARMVISFKDVDGFGLMLFGTLINMIWLFWCGCGHLSCFIAWLLEKRGPAYFIGFDKVLDSCELHHKCFRMALRKRAWIVAGVGIVFITGNIVFTGYIIFNTNMMDGMKNPIEVFMSFPVWGKTLANIALVINQFYISGTWVFPVLFAHCISYALRLELNTFNDALKTEITDDGCFNGELHKYRSRHQVITRLIEKADNLLSFNISVNLSCCMGLLIFLLYSVLWDPSVADNVLMKISYVYWIGMSSLLVGLLLYDGANINDAVSILTDTSSPGYTGYGP
jgi:hypothetical protein